MSWFVYVIPVCGEQVSVDEPTPERQSAVRDHVMRRRLQEPQGGGALAFPRQRDAVGLGHVR